MTEAEWRSSVDIAAMLEWAGDRMSPRKRRLFACACCRHVEFLIDRAFEGRRDDYRNAVETSERFADGLATEEELREAYWSADDSWFCNLDRNHSSREDGEGDPFRDVASADPEYVNDIWRQVLLIVRECGLDADEKEPDRRYDAEERAEQEVQAAFLRDLVGDLGRPAFDPALRSADAVEVARGLYEDRAFDRLSILGDSLEEAGCVDAAILDHCRTPGPHVRGCWVVDEVLGRE